MHIIPLYPFVYKLTLYLHEELQKREYVYNNDDEKTVAETIEGRKYDVTLWNKQRKGQSLLLRCNWVH